MIKAIDVAGICCILPRKGENRFGCEVMYGDGRRATVNVRPSTVLRWIAQERCIDLDRAARRSAKDTCMGHGAPIPIDPCNVFLPIHLEKGSDAEDKCVAYCNVANQKLRVGDDDPTGAPVTKLRLGDGTELSVGWSRSTLRRRLAMAMDAYAHLIERLWDSLRNTPPFTFEFCGKLNVA